MPPLPAWGAPAPGRVRPPPTCPAPAGPQTGWPGAAALRQVCLLRYHFAFRAPVTCFSPLPVPSKASAPCHSPPTFAAAPRCPVSPLPPPGQEQGRRRAGPVAQALLPVGPLRRPGLWSRPPRASVTRFLPRRRVLAPRRPLLPCSPRTRCRQGAALGPASVAPGVDAVGGRPCSPQQRSTPPNAWRGCLRASTTLPLHRRARACAAHSPCRVAPCS